MAFAGAARHEVYARMIARGWPPAMAMMRAGLMNRRRDRTDALSARPDVAARVAELRPASGREAAGPAPAAAVGPKAPMGSRAAAAVVAAPAPAAVGIDRPGPRPLLTQAEWMARYAPHLLEETGHDA